MGFLGLPDDIGGSLAAINPVAMIANLGSSLGQSYINSRAQGEANDRMEQNHWEDVRIQREDQNTAHQREVKDLTAAGLNPILSATKGAGSYSGSSPSLTAPQITAPDIMPALQFAEMQKNNEIDRDLKSAQADQIRNQIKKDSLEGSVMGDVNQGYIDLKKDINRTVKKGVKQFKNYYKMR